MKQLFIVITSLFLMFGQLHAEVQAVSVDELEQLRKIGVKIIDIRKPKELKKTGIIPGSYRLNFYEKDGKINRAKWLNRFINLVKAPYIKFVLVSTDGKQAKLGANILYDEKGYKNPYYLKGGMNSWLAHDKQTIKK